MRYVIPAGHKIQDHTCTMRMLANVFACDVVTEFNGHTLTARPGCTEYDIIREWDHACQISCFGEVVYDE